MAYTPEKGRLFWYEFDGATKYSPAFIQVIAQAGAFGVQDVFKATHDGGTYPSAFRQAFFPMRQQWVSIANIQTETIAKLLGSDWADIQAAFEDFGQGTLFEPDPDRQQNNDSIHTMDVQDDNPPVGYHRWHASIRAIQLLNIGDSGWWEQLDILVGLAWGIQSFARPRQQNMPNPRIADADLIDLRNAWLSLDASGRDRQYDFTGQAFGYHPSPKQPA